MAESTRSVFRHIRIVGTNVYSFRSGSRPSVGRVPVCRIFTDPWVQGVDESCLLRSVREPDLSVTIRSRRRQSSRETLKQFSELEIQETEE